MQSFKLDKSKSENELNWFSRHKVLTGILIFVVIGMIGSAMGGDKIADNAVESAKTPTNTKVTQPAAAAEPTTPKIGTPARDGKFEFVVKGVECGKASVGTNEYASKTAQGQYCLMTVSVKNIGDQAQHMFSMNQKLLNASNQQFSADDMATMYANGNNTNLWSSQINPGNTVEGVVAFDLPKDQTPVTAQLHDSSASGGVKVSLQ